MSKVGRELYEKFFRGYTRKQWGLDPSELDKSVTARVPTRTNRDDRYFGDEYQFMPKHGYTRMFERMLDHPNINIMVQTDYEDVKNIVPHRRLIFTGPIDEFFDYRFGKLPVSLAAVQARDARPGMAPAGRRGELSANQRLHAHHRVQASHRTDASEDGAHLRVPVRARRSVLPSAEGRRTRSSTRNTSALP